MGRGILWKEILSSLRVEAIVVFILNLVRYFKTPVRVIFKIEGQGEGVS